MAAAAMKRHWHTSGGTGVNANPGTALSYAAQACERREAQACLRLGDRYEHGVDVAPNPARAAELYMSGLQPQ